MGHASDPGELHVKARAGWAALRKVFAGLQAVLDCDLPIIAQTEGR